jgi:tripeptidyl-peptidase-1
MSLSDSLVSSDICFCLQEQKKEFVIALRQNNIDTLTNLVNTISDPNSYFYGQYIQDPSYIQHLVSPNWETEIEPIYNWLENGGIEITDDFGDSLLCSGNIEDVSELFHVNLSLTSHGDYLASTNYVIPDEFKQTIEFVDGISNRVPERPLVKKYMSSSPNSTAPIADNNYCGREVINRLYNITNLTNVSSGISLASIEYQGESGFSQDDLVTAQKLNSVPENNITHIVGNDGYPDDESQLDVQMMGINVPNADIWFWDGSKWLYTLAVKMVNAQEIPDVISMSWGWSESDQCSICNCSNLTSHQYVNRVNNEYLKLAARGVTIMVSSGDAGAPGRTNEDCSDPTNTVHATFPGSSHWVTSVGATYIIDFNLNLIINNHSFIGETPLCK